jgi:hypothetical protein
MTLPLSYMYYVDGEYGIAMTTVSLHRYINFLLMHLIPSAVYATSCLCIVPNTSDWGTGVDGIIVKYASCALAS